MRLFKKIQVACWVIAPVLGATAMGSHAVMNPMTADQDSVVTQKPVEQKLHPQSVVDEVIWVVGDEAILKSDVEMLRLQAAQEGTRWNGDPDCAIPEQIAVQKLFLQQAAIDSIEVSESEISSGIDQQINYWIEMAGSREKLEEYKNQTVAQMRADLHDDYRDRQRVQKMKEHLVKDIKVSPAEVRQYFKDLPQDSLPFVPTEVEVQIITMTPKVEAEEINRVKDELREYTDRINKGEASFQTLARFYSEDPGTARRGGEVGLTGRGTLDPSEFGFHIIQLIEKRGDKVNVRHILRKPQVSVAAEVQAINRLDSVANDIRNGKFTFEEAATVLSDDKDTRNNYGLMSNITQEGRTSKFRLQDLPAEVARVVDTMAVGQVSEPFQMINSRGKNICAIVKLKNRVEGHKAVITEDFQVMKEVVLAKRRNDVIHDWVVKKIKNVYVRINDDYKNCNFEYEGWVK